MGSVDDPADPLFRLIVGQLRDCINQHGPVTKQFIGSAAKRIYRQLIAVESNSLYACVEEQKLLDAFRAGKREQKAKQRHRMWQMRQRDKCPCCHRSTHVEEEVK